MAECKCRRKNLYEELRKVKRNLRHYLLKISFDGHICRHTHRLVRATSEKTACDICDEAIKAGAGVSRIKPGAGWSRHDFACSGDLVSRVIFTKARV